MSNLTVYRCKSCDRAERRKVPTTYGTPDGNTTWGQEVSDVS